MFKFKLIKKYKKLNFVRFISQVEIKLKLKLNIKCLGLKSNPNILSNPYKFYWFGQVINNSVYLQS